MVIASVVLDGAYGQSAEGKRAPEMVNIDGSRNPELIPEWSAWSFAFRVIATGSRQLPSSVHVVLSKEEAALLLKEVDLLRKFDRECQSRIVKLHASVGKEKNEVVDARLRELTVKCRWAALHARDRVLEQLQPESGTALAAFVGSTKAATSLTIRKQDLARFLEPQ